MGQFEEMQADIRNLKDAAFARFQEDVKIYGKIHTVEDKLAKAERTLGSLQSSSVNQAERIIQVERRVEGLEAPKPQPAEEAAWREPPKKKCCVCGGKVHDYLSSDPWFVGLGEIKSNGIVVCNTCLTHALGGKSWGGTVTECFRRVIINWLKTRNLQGVAQCQEES